MEVQNVPASWDWVFIYERLAPLHKSFEDPRYEKPHDGIYLNVLEADRITTSDQ